MLKFGCLALASILLPTCVLANADKRIILGPAAVSIPSTHPNLADLRLQTITPEKGTVRTYVKARHPTAASKLGEPNWLVLDELTVGKRYEIRICWSAVQPSEFRLNTYDLQTVFETPELISELFEYSSSRPPADAEQGDQGSGQVAAARFRGEREASVLFLQVLAAADYYTTNKTLMREVPPVYVDLILDPYLWNMIPHSLLPIIAYIAVVVVISFFLGRRISTWIRRIAMTPEQEKKTQ